MNKKMVFVVSFMKLQSTYLSLDLEVRRLVSELKKNSQLSEAISTNEPELFLHILTERKNVFWKPAYA